MYGYASQGLYVKGSLVNAEDGFQFKLRNNIDSGTVTGLTKLTVDDEPVDLGQVLVGKGEQATQKASDISWKSSVYVPYGQVITFKVLGKTLASGEHVIRLSFNTAEEGPMSARVADTE